jgi:hypothetical protein
MFVHANISASSATFQGPFGPSSGGASYAEDMERGTTARTRISGYVARATSGLSRRTALLIVGMLTGGFVWVISVAPAPVAFALTAGLAAAWCAWLETHP